LRRAVRLALLVAETAARDLLLQAKHLFVTAIVARRRVAGAVSLTGHGNRTGGLTTPPGRASRKRARGLVGRAHDAFVK
jgi:hypothetical protein